VSRAAVLGKPIAHSLSPVIHNAGFAAAGLDGWSYTAVECAEAELPDLVGRLGPEWAGLSLTMPLKEVALAVASERPAAFVVGTDVSEAALQVARRNARRHHLGSRVSLVACDLLAGLQPPDLSSNASRHPGRPPCLVVSNPPYVGLSDRGTLMPEVRDHEPAGALFAGEHGMSVIERLVPEAAAWLDTGEWLMMEVGATMAREVAGLISVSGSWQDVSVRDDYAGLPRVVKARRKPRAGESR